MPQVTNALMGAPPKTLADVTSPQSANPYGTYQPDGLDWQNMDYTQGVWGNDANEITQYGDVLRRLGYTGDLTAQGAAHTYNDVHGMDQTAYESVMNPELAKWMADNGYSTRSAKRESGNGGGDMFYGIFDKGNNLVDMESKGYSNSGGWVAPVVTGLLGTMMGGAALYGSGAMGAAGGAGGSGGGGAVGGAMGSPTAAGNAISAAGGINPGVQSAIEAAAAANSGIGAGAGAAGTSGAAGALGGESIGAIMGGGAGAGGALPASTAAAGGSWIDKIGSLFGGSGGGGGGIMDALGGGKGLADLAGSAWNVYNQNKTAQGIQDVIGQNNDDAYVKQLRSQLMREDAARGRRSDYGSREVQLLSSLADLRARRMPAQMQGLQGISNANNSMGQSLIKIGASVPWGDLWKKASNWWGD